MTVADAPSVFQAAQRAAGVIAARHRGDFAGAELLLQAFADEAERTRGFLILAELALALVKAQTDQSMDERWRRPHDRGAAPPANAPDQTCHD